MTGPALTIAGRNLMFATDGSVVDNANGNSVGTWTSVSDQKDNKIRYTVDGAAQDPLAATYQFNDSNQLEMQISTADNGAPSDQFTFIGGIEVDDDHKLNYFLVDDTGARTGFTVTLYGALSFAQDTNNLTVALTGGRTAEIQGLNGVQSLQAEKNHIAAFQADDLLIFHAETDNTIAGQTDFLVVPAVINFVGNWDIQNAQLVFQSNIKSAPGTKQVDIAFAGTLKGVTAGFTYFADSHQTQLALNIKGQHVFQSGDLTWQSSIGFTGKSFKATVDITAHTNFPDGQTLSVTGHLTLQNADRTPHPTMDLDLEAQYAFDSHNVLVFKALVADATRSYDLMLTGNFLYSNMSITFGIDFTNKPGAEELKVAVGIPGDRSSIIQKLALILDISESQAALQLNLTFNVRLQFVDGIRVKTQQPAALAAAAPAVPRNKNR
jgi:hypothetical protein